jgi:hypothetical protein
MWPAPPFSSGCAEADDFPDDAGCLAARRGRRLLGRDEEEREGDRDRLPGGGHSLRDLTTCGGRLASAGGNGASRRDAVQERAGNVVLCRRRRVSPQEWTIFAEDVGSPFLITAGRRGRFLYLLMLGAVPMAVVREPEVDELSDGPHPEPRDEVREHPQPHRTGQQVPVCSTRLLRCPGHAALPRTPWTCGGRGLFIPLSSRQARHVKRTAIMLARRGGPE